MFKRIIPALTYIYKGKLPLEEQRLYQLPDLIVTNLTEAMENLKTKNLKGANDILFYIIHEMNRKHAHLLSHFLNDKYLSHLKSF